MTLTELSYYFRKYLPFAILFFLIFLILFYTVKLSLVYLSSNKTTTISVNPIFGKIPPPTLANATASANLNFILDTVEGVPVTATAAANVYFLPQATPRFGYSEKLYLMAKSFGFDTDVVKYQLNDRTATFADSDKTLTVDIGNFNFKFDRKVNNDLFTTGALTIPAESDIQNKAINFLKVIGRYPDELSTGTNNIIYLKYNPGMENFVNVENQAQAQLVEIDFYRPNIDSFSVVAPKFFTSQNYVIMLFQGNDYQIIKSQIAFFERSPDQVGLYFIKSGDQAWQELKNGQGTVVAATVGMKNISIKSMKMGYLDPDIYQNYLQPVYVFLGDGNFAAYVPAVKE